MIFDLHNDFYTSKKQGAAEFLKDAKKLVGCVAVQWTSESNRIVEPNRRIKKKNVLFAVEDMQILSKEGENTIKNLSAVYCSLTWNNDNSLAGGAYGSRGLTENGKRMIVLLERCNTIIDCAHLNEKSFYEVADVAERIMISHTCVKELKSHPRNVDASQMKLVAEKNGIIGLTPVLDFLRGSRLDDFAAAIDFVVEKIGENFVAIGTDFNGTTNFPDWLSSYSDFEKLRYTLENLGYSSDVIKKIFYKNALRIFEI